MDTKARDARSKAIAKVEPEKKEAGLKLNREEENESESLLRSQNGEISNGLPKTRRKVRWNDSIGNKLAEVLEFQPRSLIVTDLVIICQRGIPLLSSCLLSLAWTCSSSNSWWQFVVPKEFLGEAGARVDSCESDADPGESTRDLGLVVVY
ncbi:hypothetical protein Ancab_030156 [Ancistrocladus abbreviatus]